jgi:hypothetical protein
LLDKRQQQRRAGMVIAVLFVAVVAMVVLTWPSTWIEAGPAGCKVHNPYTDSRSRRGNRPAKITAATWNGPCVAGLAEGWGTLDWIRDARIGMHYEGEIVGGRMTGSGAMTVVPTRYEGRWNDGALQHGLAIYPDERRFEGDWYQGRWSRAS